MDVRGLGFRTDLALLRLGGSQIVDRGDHLVVRTPHNPNFWWGNFLLMARAPGPAEVERWIARFEAEFPQASHLTLGVDGAPGGTEHLGPPDLGPPDLGPLASQGFEIEASTVMTARTVLPPPHPNREAVCRPLAGDRDWGASVELRMRCDADGYDPATHRAFVVAKAATTRRLVDDGHATWFGAFVDGELAAQLGIVRVDGGLARFQSVETDPAFRRRGLCGTLVHLAARHALDEWGAATLVMVADPDYAAIRSYRALGFVAAETQHQASRRPERPLG